MRSCRSTGDSTQATIKREAAAAKQAVDGDPAVAVDERGLVSREIEEVQGVLQRLIQSQQVGLDRLRRERDDVASKIQRLNQGRRALTAYGGRDRPGRA